MIFFDAAVGQFIGAILDAHWDGQKEQGDDTYIYSANAYRLAFIVMPVSFGLSFFMALMLRGYAAELDEHAQVSRGNVLSQGDDPNDKPAQEIVYVKGETSYHG